MDGVLVALAPQGMTDPSEAAMHITCVAKMPGKPLLASWMGGDSVGGGNEILNAAGIPTFAFPDRAARAFVYMWQYSDNLRALYETPELAGSAPDCARAAELLETARVAGRTLLTEVESKQLLAAYGIPVTRTEVAATEDDAVRIATGIGFPVVVKLHSLTVTHKTDVGGVELGIANESDVRAAWKRIREGVTTRKGAEHFQGVSVQPMARWRDAYELILGSSTDAQFGPVLLFGAGGQLVEVFRDRALGLPPLTTTLARRLMERTKIYKALGGVRGRAAVDQAHLEQTLVRFSQLVAEQPRIKEIDINPLLASPAGVLALDARVVLHEWDVDVANLPRTAVRPYPSAYVTSYMARNGAVITIRPIRPEDEPAMVQFHETLSERSVYMRYFHHMRLSQRVAHERLTRICFIDYDREMILVAETADRAIVAAGRLSRGHGRPDGEFAVLVSDAWQDQGLGTELIHSVVSIARQEKISRLWGHILSENRTMQELARQAGFELRYSVEEGVVEASLVLEGD